MKFGSAPSSMIAPLAAAAMLLAACGNGNGLPGSPNGDGGGNGSTALTAMGYWDGCEALDDLQPLQDFLGVEEVNSGDGMTTSEIGEGMDAESAGCQAMADLATYVLDSEFTEFEHTGGAIMQAGLVPWDSEEEASENLEMRLDQLEDAKHQGTEYTDEQEGELGGEWSESYYLAADIEYKYTVNAYGRVDDWLVYLTLDVDDDPGVTGGEEAVYPFTEEELVDWVVNDYMTQLQDSIVAKAESQ